MTLAELSERTRELEALDKTGRKKGASVGWLSALERGQQHTESGAVADASRELILTIAEALNTDPDPLLKAAMKAPLTEEERGESHPRAYTLVVPPQGDATLIDEYGVPHHIPRERLGDIDQLAEQIIGS